jgi:hypothetical protein
MSAVRRRSSFGGGFAEPAIAIAAVRVLVLPASSTALTVTG